MSEGGELTESFAYWLRARLAIHDARLRLGAAYTNHPTRHREARCRMLWEAFLYLEAAAYYRERAKACT